MTTLFYRYIILTVLALSLGLTGFSQPDPGAAKEHFKHHNFLSAIPAYKRLIKHDPKNADYYHKLGYCYIHTQIDKTLAIDPLEKAIALPKVDVEAYFDLAEAYTYDYDFEKALAMFEKYKGMVEGQGESVLKADLGIFNCAEAKKLMEYPLNVTFTNMGEKINGEYPDYYPYCSKDASTLVYTSRRKANKGGSKEVDGYYSSDIWVVKSDETGYSAGKNLPGINGVYDEQAVGITDDGSTMFVYIDHIDVYGDIYTSAFAKGKYQRLKKMNENVNTKSLETSATMSKDGNTLFFTSARDGGYGGLDLWMSRLLPTGEWALPMNLGPEINTAYDEGFPTLSAGNEFLYFCSEGHPGMGGFDVFKLRWNNESGKFSTPENLGYPVNTPEDNRTISFTADGKHAFVSALRKGGYGDYDIYKITFNDVSIIPAVFTVHLMTGDSINPHAKQGTIYLFDSNGDEAGIFAPNPNSGKIVMAMMPGMYSMEVEVDGFAFKTEDFFVTDFHLRCGIVAKEITLEH